MQVLFNDIVKYSGAVRELQSPALAETCEVEQGITLTFDRFRNIDCIGLGNTNATYFTVCGTNIYNKTPVLKGGKAETAFFDYILEGGNSKTTGEHKLPDDLMNDLQCKKYTVYYRPALTLNGGKADTVFFNFELEGGSASTKTWENLPDSIIKELEGKTGGAGLYMLGGEMCENKVIIKHDGTYLGRLALGKACNIPTQIAKEPNFQSTSASRRTLSGQVVEGLGGYNFRGVSLDSRYQIDSFIMNEIKEGYPQIASGYPLFVYFDTEKYKLPFERLYATDSNTSKFSFESGVRRPLYSRRFDFSEAF